ncbi:conjugal transfer protein TraI [Mucilaginibacter pocheonensis]|uniref:Mannitol-specific phosphotransferase system IIBC component n=1 Tax=Mucilaginibacter pocheonensis TaxID=398050 RepID=A0ABU1T7J5_9SPHI|nr:conjugal transfer protein TraI [Mucilaginibacter pocheonensis]MDR6941376.1 mannitol-specific phosphotransferase system IIBC component [Mucilaginibacter pocheonensis]
MKKYMVILPLSAISIFVSIPKGADAQFIVGSVISSTVGRVIRAIDLEVQRMQNQTIWLQNAQKALENQLSKLKLDEISNWSSKQKDLFGQYYQELWEIKTTIAYYSKISELTQKQVALVNAYNQAWNLLKSDKHFTTDELAYMTKVYSGILQASVNDLDQILLVINANKTRMPDAKRMEIVNKAADHMDTNYNDLQQFNNQNKLLSLQRASDENEILTLKKYYGID